LAYSLQVYLALINSPANACAFLNNQVGKVRNIFESTDVHFQVNEFEHLRRRSRIGTKRIPNLNSFVQQDAFV
jgi:hypothetical protein